MPRQFGPISRAPCARTSASSCLLAARALGAGLREAGGDHAQRLAPLRERRLGRVEHRVAGKADDGEVDLARDVRDRRVRPDAGDRLAATSVDRVRGAGEVARRGCSGRARRRSTRAGRDAPMTATVLGSKNGRERRGHRDVVALVDAPRGSSSRRRDREPHLDRRRSRAGARRRSRRPRTRAASAGSSGITSATNVVDPGRGGATRRAARAAACRRPGPGARRRPRRRPRRTPGRGDERSSRARRPLLAGPLRACPISAPLSSQSGSTNGSTSRPRHAREAVEAQVDAALRHRLEEVDDQVDVGLVRRAKPERAAAPEDDVTDVRGCRRHCVQCGRRRPAAASVATSGRVP